MFEFSWEWITSLAKEALIERGVPEVEAEDMILKGDEWLERLQVEAARKEFLDYISIEKSMVAWAENSFTSGPATDAAIKHHTQVIEDMTEYVNNYLGGTGV